MIPSFSLPLYCRGCSLSLIRTHCSSALGCGVLLFTPVLLPEIISGGTGVCWRIPLRPCSCWNHSGVFFVFFFFGDPRGKEWPARRISQAEATWCFEWKAFADWGLWQAGEAGAGVLSERFDTPSNSPLSLALVSKQYRSLNCSSAYSCCHTSSLLSH